MIREKQIEENFINKLIELKYKYRSDICDRDSLELNFRKKFERLNRVKISAKNLSVSIVSTFPILSLTVY